MVPAAVARQAREVLRVDRLPQLRPEVGEEPRALRAAARDVGLVARQRPHP